MLQRTLDLLDADLRQGFADYTLSAKKRQLFYSRSIQADPVQWARFNQYFGGQTFTWQEFRYRDVAAANDLGTRINSNSPGVYIFFVQPDISIASFPRFPFYCGISNDRGSNRPIRTRLEDYFRMSGITKRGNVHTMLQLYYPYVWVTYTLLNWTSARLKTLETNLHEYLGVPFSSQAYTPATKAARNAWDR